MGEYKCIIKAENNNIFGSYISLGIVEKEQLFNEFSESVFKLRNNEFTKLIKTDIGWHILKVTEIIKSKSKDFNEVRDVIKKDIITNKSYDEFDIILNEVEDKLTNEEKLKQPLAGSLVWKSSCPHLSKIANEYPISETNDVTG